MIAVDVVARRFSADGTPLGAELALSTTRLDDQEDLAIGVDGTGAGVAVYARFYEASGQPAGDPVLVDMPVVGDQGLPSAAIHLGRAVVVLQSDPAQDGDGLGIFANSFDAGGQAAGPEVQIHTSTAGPQMMPVIRSDGLGRFVVLWVDDAALDGDGRGIFGQRLSSVVFADGFESGDTSAWSLAVP